MPVGFAVCSQIACVTIWAVPGARAMCASQHIRVYGTTMDGATLCPGSSKANNTSFALHGLLGPQIAVMIADSKLLTSLGATSASSTPNSVAATIITAATVAFLSKPPGIVLVFRRAAFPSFVRLCSSGPVPHRGSVRTPTPRCLNFCWVGMRTPSSVTSNALGRLRAECAAVKASDFEAFTSCRVSVNYLLVAASIASRDRRYTVSI